MLRLRTVFVIGAGAGVPYGFLTGAGMLDDARRLNARQIRDLTLSLVSEAEANSLKDALAKTLAMSVDAMLEQRAELWPSGKKLLAGMLLRSEYTARIKNRTSVSDWLPLVFHMLTDGAKSIEDFSAVMSGVSFITFNYDRTLEYRLRDGLESRYGCTKDKCSAIVNSLAIVHVYGSIGPVWKSEAMKDRVQVVPYGPDLSDTNGVLYLRAAMDNAGSTVRIIHETEDSSAEVEQARKLLENAEQVFFLGFGFGERNVARLAIVRIPESARIFCSAFGMTEGEVRRYIYHPFGRRAPTSKGQITDMLREIADRFA